MRLTAAEKREVIRLVEDSDLSVRHTVRELQVRRSTFYTWYRRYAEAGLDGLTPRPAAARWYWNRIPRGSASGWWPPPWRRRRGPRGNWRGNSRTARDISSRTIAS